jgi:hypothetical protein
MAWRSITEADLLQRISADELESIREAALGDDQGDPIATHLSQVADYVRGYIAANAANTLGAAGTIPERLIVPACDYALVNVFSRLSGMLLDANDTRKRASDAAIRLFERVADGHYAVEQPTEAGTEVEASPSPSFTTPTHVFQPSNQDGL